MGGTEGKRKKQNKKNENENKLIEKELHILSIIESIGKKN